MADAQKWWPKLALTLRDSTAAIRKIRSFSLARLLSDQARPLLERARGLYRDLTSAILTGEIHTQILTQTQTQTQGDNTTRASSSTGAGAGVGVGVEYISASLGSSAVSNTTAQAQAQAQSESYNIALAQSIAEALRPAEQAQLEQGKGQGQEYDSTEEDEEEEEGKRGEAGQDYQGSAISRNRDSKNSKISENKVLAIPQSTPTRSGSIDNLAPLLQKTSMDPDFVRTGALVRGVDAGVSKSCKVTSKQYSMLYALCSILYTVYCILYTCGV